MLFTNWTWTQLVARGLYVVVGVDAVRAGIGWLACVCHNGAWEAISWVGMKRLLSSMLGRTTEAKAG
jgi:hypothetical protein